MSKKLVTLDDGQFGLETSLRPLIEKLHQIFVEEMADDGRFVDKDRIFEMLEKMVGRPLSKYEMDTVKEWLSEGESYDTISGAIEIAKFANRRNINYIDQILVEYRMKKDMDNEGISVASNNKWSKNLSATIELARLDWVNQE